MTTKRPRLKVVCMCRGGNVRSVAMKMILNRYLGHSSLACGLDTNDEETRRFLFEWADVIVVMHKEMACYVTDHYQFKLKVVHVGNDVWGDPFNEELQLKIVHILNAQHDDLNPGRLIDPAKVLKRLRDYKLKIESRNAEDAIV